jgi:hypothetical protein
MSSSQSPAGPDSTSTSRSLKCEQCSGMTFNTTEELAEHNRKEHTAEFDKEIEVIIFRAYI